VEVLLHPVTEPEGGASHPFYSSFPSFSSSSSLFSSVLRELLLWHVVECFYIHTIDDSTVRQKKNERKVMFLLFERRRRTIKKRRTLAPSGSGMESGDPNPALGGRCRRQWAPSPSASRSAWHHRRKHAARAQRQRRRAQATQTLQVPIHRL
jgi:hypothetical protein